MKQKLSSLLDELTGVHPSNQAALKQQILDLFDAAFAPAELQKEIFAPVAAIPAETAIATTDGMPEVNEGTD